MKTFAQLLLAAFIALGTPVFAGTLSTPPLPDEGNNVKEKGYDLTVDGVKVIVQPSNANQVIAVTVCIMGSYANGEATNPALPSSTVLLATSSGSKKYPKDLYRAALSRLVTSISGDADAYHSNYTLNCVRPKFDESWKIFEDVIDEPNFDETEFSNMREQELTDIEGRKSDPEGWGYFMLDSIWHAGHPAGRVSEPSDVQALTIPTMQQFHNKTTERSRMIIVIVGDVTKDEVEAKVGELVRRLPQGNYQIKPFDRVTGPGTSKVVIEPRSLPTTYVMGMLNGPDRTTADFWPMTLASSILSDRLYEEVRTKRNLSYAPSARFGGKEGTYELRVGVSSTAPDSAMHVIRRELDKIRDAGVTAKELRDTKESFLTQMYMGQQSNLGEAYRLLNNQLESGDYHETFRTLNRVESVTVEQIQAAMKKYIHTIYWTAVGDAAKTHESDFLYP